MIIVPLDLKPYVTPDPIAALIRVIRGRIVVAVSKKVLVKLLPIFFTERGGWDKLCTFPGILLNLHVVPANYDAIEFVRLFVVRETVFVGLPGSS